MFLPIFLYISLADANPLRQMFCLDYGLAEWWYCNLVADGIATNVFTGRCYNECVCSGGMTTLSRCYVVADGKSLAEF